MLPLKNAHSTAGNVDQPVKALVGKPGDGVLTLALTRWTSKTNPFELFSDLHMGAVGARTHGKYIHTNVVKTLIYKTYL